MVLDKVKSAIKYLEIDAKEHADRFSQTMFVSTRNILAIAEAFREMEQRAEAAEAQLAELAKQEPVAYRWEGKGSGNICYEGIKPLGVICQPLFTRPAPAAVPAAVPVELVPDEMYPDHPKMRWVGIDELFPRIEGWNACRDEMLRRIEELK